MSVHQYLEQVLGNLELWKQYPKYQYERRIDALIAPFVADIVSQHFGEKITLVAPEFPIKKHDNNQSFNADYLLLEEKSDGSRVWILLELKTDAGSVNRNQEGYYHAVQKHDFAVLYQQFKQIETKTKAIHKEKYGRLDEQLQRHLPLSGTVKVVYLAPAKAEIHSAFGRITLEDALNSNVHNYGEAWGLVTTHLKQTLK